MLTLTSHAQRWRHCLQGPTGNRFGWLDTFAKDSGLQSCALKDSFVIQWCQELLLPWFCCGSEGLGPQLVAEPFRVSLGAQGHSKLMLSLRGHVAMWLPWRSYLLKQGPMYLPSKSAVILQHSSIVENSWKVRSHLSAFLVVYLTLHWIYISLVNPCSTRHFAT